MSDANDQLQVAFEAECAEHLEAMRARLTALAAAPAPSAGDLDDIFRRAHSLKGAARITGASVVEQLAHRLETLFEHARNGVLAFDNDTVCIIHLALDAIEDSVASLGRRGLPAVPQQVLAELDGLSAQFASPKEAASDFVSLDERLLAAFHGEYREYLDRISLVLTFAEQKQTPPTDELAEALRCAHSLKGAARAAGVPDVDVLAEVIEGLFSRVLGGQSRFDESLVSTLRFCLTAIDDYVPSPTEANRLRLAEARTRIGQCIELETRPIATRVQCPSPSDTTAPLAGSEPAPRVATAADQADFVRISAASLDRLLQSSGELYADSYRQDLVTKELAAIPRQVAHVEREWKQVKKLISASGHGPVALGGDRIGAGVERLDHHLGSLLRQARSMCRLQHGTAWSLRQLAEQLQRDVRRARMVPAETMFHGFRKMMRDLARDQQKQVDFRVSGFDIEADRTVLQTLKDSLMHALRNAITHGVESPGERQAQGKPPAGRVMLRVEAIGSRLTIDVEDDGRGIDLARAAQAAVQQRLLTAEEAASASPPELARLLFHTGLSTAAAVTELSGRGLGLSVVQEAVARLQGDVELRPREGGGTALRICVPLAVSTHRLLLVACQSQTFAIPIGGVESLHRIKAQSIETVEGRPVVVLHGRLTSVVTLGQLLQLPDAVPIPADGILCVAVLRTAAQRLAVVVDSLLAERDALIKRLGPPADRIAHFSGGMLLEDGSVALVLNNAVLLRNFQTAGRWPVLQRPAQETPRAPTILVVDDSFTTRTLETSILETHGYDVRVAVDGVAALAALRSAKIDLVITDIQMPRLDGFGLLEEIKKDSRLAQTPVIIVSSVDRREDQQRGMSLGADAYIVKRKFDHHDLLQSIQQLL